jgi:DNA-binding transcriptional LysR family regulator
MHFPDIFDVKNAYRLAPTSSLHRPRRTTQFRRGAQAVNLSQSAFSRSIQALEHSVGCQLVDRGRKELAPTKQGQVLLEHARRLVSGAQQWPTRSVSSMAWRRANCASVAARRRRPG